MADRDKETIAEEYISSLQRRLELLEERLIGEDKVREGQPPLLHLLKTIDGKLKALVESVKGNYVQLVWNKIPDLERILDPSYLRSLNLNAPAKEELLLYYAEQLQKYQNDIDDLQDLKDSVNVSSFQGTESTQRELSLLAANHIRQEEEVEDLTSRVHRFIDQYSKLILALSAQCVEWDEIITQLETQKK